MNISNLMLIVLAFAIVFLLYDKFSPNKILPSFNNVLTKEEVGNKVINYINDNLVQEGTKASLVEVKDVGYFFEVVTDYLGNRISVYSTKDGRYLILSQGLLDMEEKVERTTQTTSNRNTEGQNRIQLALDLNEEPYIGNKDAKVIMVEATDYQCPFCKRAHDTTFPEIKRNYIDTGKLLYVVKDFPLSFHQNADEAAEAAGCALEQGLDKFWKMHDLLFEKQSEWAYASNPKDIFKNYAQQLGLDSSKFNNCLDSGKRASEVQNDFSEMSNIVSGTPTFFIGNPTKGYIRIVGAQPYSVFQQAIESELSSN